MKKNLLLFLLFSLPILLTGCNLQQDIEIELPPHKPQLIVECYLEPGQPYRLSVLESVGYFDPLQIPTVPDAQAFIMHNGRRINLSYRPTVDLKFNKYYTHSSSTVMDGKPGDVLTLEVWDEQGRKVTGQTTILTQVPIEKIEWRYNSKEEALLLTSFQDDAATANFYRYTINRDSLERPSQRDIVSSDELTNGQQITYGGPYSYEKGDTLVVTLFHIEKKYHDFLNSVATARSSANNPFGQPSKITSGVTGGIGIFTNLVYDRKTVILD